MKKAHIPDAAILVILLLSCGEYAMVAGHYLAQFDGVVVARTNDVHYPPWTRNLATRYVWGRPLDNELSILAIQNSAHP